MVNRCLLRQQNMSGQHQKRHLFPISFVSLNKPDFLTSYWPEKWGDLNMIEESHSFCYFYGIQGYMEEPPHTYDEPELIRRIAEGDEVSFRQIFHYYNQKLFPVVVALVRS